MPKILETSAAELEEKPRKAPGASLFVRKEVLEKMTDHADEGLDEEKEIMGLMVGKLYRDNKGVYAEVFSVITSNLQSDMVSVRFDSVSMDDLFDAIDELEDDNMVVGWYHSHPGFGCFMSETDIKTQDGLFGKLGGFAIVIDPVRQELKAFDSNPGDPSEIKMIILE